MNTVNPKIACAEIYIETTKHCSPDICFRCIKRRVGHLVMLAYVITKQKKVLQITSCFKGQNTELPSTFKLLDFQLTSKCRLT